MDKCKYIIETMEKIHYITDTMTKFINLDILLLSMGFFHSLFNGFILNSNIVNGKV